MIKESITYIKTSLQTLEKLTMSLSDKESRNLMITDRWNLNNTIAHIVGWAEQLRKEIKFLLESKNESFPWFINAKNNWTAFNDQNVTKYQSISLQELIELYKHINEQIIELVEKNKESSLLEIKHEIKYYGKFSPVTILEMIRMKFEHEQVHLIQIREKIKTQPNNGS